jgi:hypothetical protein
MTMYRAVDRTRNEGSPYPVKVWFSEVVATTRDGAANERWSKAPIQMLTKCTEAAGLREAFPEEFGGEHTAEEMEGRRLGEDDPDSSPAVTAPPFQRKSDVVDAPQPPSPLTTVETGPTPSEERVEESAIEAETTPTNVGVIVTLKEGAAGAVTAELNTGFKAGTRDTDLIAALRGLHRQQRRVELVTKPSSNVQKFYPKVVEILPLGPEPAA